MKPSNQRTFAERRPADCWDWIRPEDAIRHALAAFYAHCRQLDALPPDPLELNATFNNGRRAFAEDVAETFLVKLLDQGARAGAPGFDSSISEYLKLRLAPIHKKDEISPTCNISCEPANIQAIHWRGFRRLRT